MSRNGHDLIDPEYYRLPAGIEVHQLIGDLPKYRADAVQYALRAGHKVMPGSTVRQAEIVDLKKALRSLELELQRLEGSG